MSESAAAEGSATPRVLLVDALNLIRRVYAAQPGEDGAPRAEEGRTASIQSLRRALREVSPTHAVAVFEGEGPTWRHRLFDGYKAGHRPMPEALAEALPRYEAAFAEAGVRSLRSPGVEADDVAGTLAVKVAGIGGVAVVLSTDKIFYQLVSGRIVVRDHFEKSDRDPRWVLRRFGVPPERFVDYLALVGDAGNGISGVAGVGPKTAARLITDHDSLDAVLAAAEEGRSETLTAKLAERLAGGKGEALLARRLLRLRTDLELGVRLKELRYAP